MRALEHLIELSEHFHFMTFHHPNNDFIFLDGLFFIYSLFCCFSLHCIDQVLPWNFLPKTSIFKVSSIVLSIQCPCNHAQLILRIHWNIFKWLCLVVVFIFFIMDIHCNLILLDCTSMVNLSRCFLHFIFKKADF